jgi:hypothetical protein
MRSYACLGKYRRRCKGKSQSNKCGTDHSLTFHDLPSCVTLHHLPSSARLLKIRKAPPRLFAASRVQHGGPNYFGK